MNLVAVAVMALAVALVSSVALKGNLPQPNRPSRTPKSFKTISDGLLLVAFSLVGSFGFNVLAQAGH